MNRVPDDLLAKIPGGTLMTQTPEEGRALAFAIAQHTIHNIQPDLDVLKGGRPNYLNRPGCRAHAFLREGWHDAEQVRREQQGQGGPADP